MKKFIFCIVCTLFVFQSWGQLQITGHVKTEHISSVRAKTVRLNKMNNDWYLVMKSSNQFDDPGIFGLGNTAEKAIATLSDLGALFDAMGEHESIDVEDAYGQEYTIQVGQFMGIKCLAFNSSEYAGIFAQITPKVIEKFKQAIADYPNNHKK